jgi:DNA-binding IclR family transcriptional regulator
LPVAATQGAAQGSERSYPIPPADRHLPDKNSGQVSRLLKRLRVHGLIKKVGRTYKYYLTQFGKEVVASGLKLRELVVIPQLAFGHLA